MTLRFWKRQQAPTVVVPVRPETYEGRLYCDGDGHLRAQDGPFAGDPVAHEPGRNAYVFTDESYSHNQRHHNRFVVIDGTTEADPHHFMLVQGDAHEYGIRFDPDHVAATLTGHTKAYTS